MDPSVSSKNEIWFLRVCHHISDAVYCSNVPERERESVCVFAETGPDMAEEGGVC